MGRTGHPLAASLTSTLAASMILQSTTNRHADPPAAATTSLPVRPSVTIVLPTYNEAHRIGPALDELFGWLRRGGPPRTLGRSSDELGEWDVLVVDDGSDDDTVAIVEARSEAQVSAVADNGGTARLSVMRRPHGGKGAAVTAGILAARGDLIIFADADMATPPDQIPLLTEALLRFDLALGSRIQPDGSDRRASQPLYRRLLGRVYRSLAGVWVTGDVPDTQCGFKGFRRDAGRDIFGRLRTRGIVFDAEVIFLSRRLGYRHVAVPVMWHDIRGSRMRVRPRLALGVLWDLLRIPLLHRDVRRQSSPPPAHGSS
jgi:dolichyl-phosphate beta-glucosyltransferase